MRSDEKDAGEEAAWRSGLNVPGYLLSSQQSRNPVSWRFSPMSSSRSVTVWTVSKFGCGREVLRFRAELG